MAVGCQLDPCPETQGLERRSQSSLHLRCQLPSQQLLCLRLAGFLLRGLGLQTNQSPAWLRPSPSEVGLLSLQPLSWPYQLVGPTSPVRARLLRVQRVPEADLPALPSWPLPPLGWSEARRVRRVLTRCPAPKMALTPALVPVGLAQPKERPWTGLTLLLLLLRLPRPVRLFALDPFGSWPLSWPLSDVLADSFLGRIDCFEIDPCLVGFVPTNCCRWLSQRPLLQELWVLAGSSLPSHGLPSPELASHGRPKGRPIPGFPGVIPRSRFVWTLLRSLGHVGLSSVWAGLPAALAGGAARSLTWRGGATHAAPLPCKGRDGSGQRIGLSQVTYPASWTSCHTVAPFSFLECTVVQKGLRS